MARRARQVFSDLTGAIDARNQARTHVQDVREFGVADKLRLKRTTDGVDRFLAVCAMIAVRRVEGGNIELYAPLGVDDIVHRVIRPNPRFRAARRDAYARKAEHWSTVWPELIVAPFGTRH